MGRAPCCEKVGLNRGPWTREEDLLLTQYINEHGEGAWRTLPKAAGLRRCGKSCRLRWINYLRPDIKHGNISEEEDQMIIKLHSLLGNRWSLIAARLPGRTDNEIKNHWNTHLKKKLRNMGIDPQSHCPIEQNGAGSSSSSGISYSNPRAPCFQDTLESLTLESRSPTTLQDLPIDQSGCSAFKKYNKSDKSASKDDDLEQLCSCESHGFSTEEHAEDLTAVSDAADSSPRDLAPSFSCELCPVTVYWDGKQDASTSSLLLNIMHSDVSWDVEILHPIDNLDQPNPASADLWGCH